MTNKINDIFRMFSAEYIERYPNMPIQHRKIISAIKNCRSGSYGTTVFRCSQCGQKHFVSRSCGNRHCPQCQHHKTQQWLEKQLDKQVPGQHFMITLYSLYCRGRRPVQKQGSVAPFTPGFFRPCQTPFHPLSRQIHERDGKGRSQMPDTGYRLEEKMGC